MWRQTGNEPDGLDALVVPDGCEAIVFAFRELNARRSSNGFGPNPLNHRDVESYCALSGIRLTPWQVSTLLAMDDAALAAMAKARASKDKDDGSSR